MSFIMLFNGCSREPFENDAFAQCLTDNGVKMFGTNTCKFCKKQKEQFGPSFDKIDYVNCGTDREACKDAGITGYPTWMFSNGEKLPGLQPLSYLSNKTGCELPQS